MNTIYGMYMHMQMHARENISHLHNIYNSSLGGGGNCLCAAFICVLEGGC